MSTNNKSYFITLKIVFMHTDNNGPGNQPENDQVPDQPPARPNHGSGQPKYDFSIALDHLKAGKRIAREGWNGKGMFLLLAGGYTVAKENLRPNGPITKEFLESRGLQEMEILPHIDMWTVNSHGRQAYLSGWLASQTDLLSNDWIILD